MEKAIAHFEAAHAVFTRDATPSHWAGQHRAIADAYRSRIKGERAANLARAVAGYEASLTVYTRDAFPNEHLRSAQRLASVSLETGDWQKAGRAADSAREAFLLLFGQGLNAGDAASLLEAAGPLFADAAFAASRRGEVGAAMTLAAEGRARLMAAALRLQELGLDAAGRRRLDDLRASIREQSRIYDATTGLERSATLDKLAGLRRELLTMMQEAERTGKAPGDASAVASQLVPAGGVIVVPAITKVGAAFFILSSANPGHTTVLQLADLTSARLDSAHARRRLRRHARWLAWGLQCAIPSAAGTGSQDRRMDRCNREHRSRALAPVCRPPRCGVAGARHQARLRIVWLPTSTLGLLPLGLARDPKSATRFGEKYELVTAPSLEALAQAARQITQGSQPSLIAVVNPTGDLPFTEVEATLVAFHFAGRPRFTLDETSATPKAVLASLKDKSYWHFASHGFFDWSDARKSGLKMRGRCAAQHRRAARCGRQPRPATPSGALGLRDRSL